MFKQITNLGIITTLLLLTNIKNSHATTFILSGFSLSDGMDTYTAQGSFEWDGGALSTLSQNDLQIQNTFNLEVSDGNSYTKILNPSNIDFSSTTINGMVNADNSLVSFSTIDILDDSFNVLLSDNGFDQMYDDFDNVISLSTQNGDTGTSFNNAIAQTPEGSNFIGLGLVTLLAFWKPKIKFDK